MVSRLESVILLPSQIILLPLLHPDFDPQRCRALSRPCRTFVANPACVLASSAASEARKCPEAGQRAHRGQPGPGGLGSPSRAHQLEAFAKCPHRVAGARYAPPG